MALYVQVLSEDLRKWTPAYGAIRDTARRALSKARTKLNDCEVITLTFVFIFIISRGRSSVMSWTRKPNARDKLEDVIENAPCGRAYDLEQ